MLEARLEGVTTAKHANRMTTQFTPRLLAESTAKYHISAPTKDIDITDWIFHVDELEYVNCTPQSKAHITAVFTHAPDGKRMSINVEVIGGALIVEHYNEAISEKLHCRVVSTSDFVINGQFTTGRVTWELIATPVNENCSDFVNNEWVHTTEKYEQFLTKHGINFEEARKNFQKAVDAHNAEETPYFAQAIERRALNKKQ